MCRSASIHVFLDGSLLIKQPSNHSRRPRYDEFLAAPEEIDLKGPVATLERASTTYTSHDSRFILKGRNYDRQYAQLYFYRLVQMRPMVEAEAKARWPGVPVTRVLDVSEEAGEQAVIGTLYKEMALKPSILDEYTKDRVLGTHLGRTRFTQPEDRVVLEDEGARVTLTGTGIDPGSCVTGLVAAVRGVVLSSGEFEVRDVCYAGMAPQPPLPSDITGATDKYVAFVSGLSLGAANAKLLPLQLLVDYCTGALGSMAEQNTASHIVRVVIAGGLLDGSPALSQPTAYSSARQQASALAPVREADVRLTELASALPLDVMPGAADPSNYSLPQQPLHRCLFPGAGRFSTLSRCTNPHDFELDGVRILGTSGQNVDDVARYSDLDDAVEIMERLLMWRHLIPTAPDTLAAYPFYDADPFIIKETPHVLFAGGQPRFGTKLVESEAGHKVRIIAVPDFSKSGAMILVNLKSLAVHPIYFEVDEDT